jgi:hypothetical protein
MPEEFIGSIDQVNVHNSQSAVQIG